MPQFQDTVVNRLQQPCWGPSLSVENEGQASLVDILQKAATHLSASQHNTQNIEWALHFREQPACWYVPSPLWSSFASKFANHQETYLAHSGRMQLWLCLCRHDELASCVSHITYVTENRQPLLCRSALLQPAPEAAAAVTMYHKGAQVFCGSDQVQWPSASQVNTIACCGTLIACMFCRA